MYLFRAIMPNGAMFDGQMVFSMPDFVAPYDWRKYVDSIDIVHVQKFVNKMTGFETTKHRIQNSSSNDILGKVTVTLAGNLPRIVQQFFMRLAEGFNGSGIDLQFYDDMCSNFIYKGKWIGAGDFVDNSEGLNGGSIEIAVYNMVTI